MNKGYIYLLENSINDKLYVGLSFDPERRLFEHCKPCKRWKSAISNTINKYGRNNFELIYLESSDNLDILNEKEQYWIKELNTLAPNGYNLRKGGEAGGIPTEEVRKKMSESKKKANITYVRGKDHWSYGKVSSFKGKKHTEEAKEKMRLAKLGNENCVGRVLSERTKEKISEAHKKAYKNRQRDFQGRFI